MLKKRKYAPTKLAQCDPKKLTHKAFEALELRVGTIRGVKLHPKTDDYLLDVDLGPVEQDIQIIADLKDGYTIDELMGKQVMVWLNVCSTTVEGEESEGMLLITECEGRPVLLGPSDNVHPGIKIMAVNDGTCVHFQEE